MRSFRRVRVATVAAGLALLSVGTPLGAQDAPIRNHLYDRWQLSAAGALVIFDTRIRVDNADGTRGTEIDTEKDLGLDRTKFHPRFTARWRPGRRHELELGYQFARRTTEGELAEEITFEDTVFAANAAIRAENTSDNLFLRYRFAFAAREGYQIGFGFGLGAIFQNTYLAALGEVSGGGESRVVEYDAEAGITAPTASIGLYGRFRLSDPLTLQADLRGIYVKIDRYKGQILEPEVGLSWFPWRNVGFEGAWSGQFIRIDVDPEDDFGGWLKYRNQVVRLAVLITP